MKHPHGTDRAYVHDHCRCTTCREAHAKVALTRRRQIGYGRYQNNKRPATKARDHIQTLRNAGLALQQIHEHTGISLFTLGRIARGQQSIIQGHTERRILALKPEGDHLNPRTRIDSTGTARRLQALQVNGWSQKQLAHRLGITMAQAWKLTHQQRSASLHLAEQVANLYDELWATPAPDNRESRTIRTIAKRRGWLPALAWDDELIDNPEHQGHPMEIAA